MIRATQLENRWGPAAAAAGASVLARPASTAPEAPMSATAQQAVRLTIVWLLILPLAMYWVTQVRQLQPSVPALLNVLPLVPKPGEAAVASLRVNNARPTAGASRYELYANGRLVAEGVT